LEPQINVKINDKKNLDWSFFLPRKTRITRKKIKATLLLKPPFSCYSCLSWFIFSLFIFCQKWNVYYGHSTLSGGLFLIHRLCKTILPSNPVRRMPARCRHSIILFHILLFLICANLHNLRTKRRFPLLLIKTIFPIKFPRGHMVL
jgi:hypothetical protein